MGKKDRCTVLGCFPGKYMLKDRTSFFAIGGTFPLLQGPRALGYLEETTEKGFKVTKNTKDSSNHFKFGRPVGSRPHPTFFLKGL